MADQETLPQTPMSCEGGAAEGSPSPDDQAAPPAPSALLYEYERFEDAPDKHREIMRWVVAGFTEQRICDELSVSSAVVKKVLAHPPIAGRLEELRQLQSAMALEEVEQLTGLKKKLFSRLRDAADDEDTKTKDIIHMAEFVADRHPTRPLPKRVRGSQVGQVNIIAGSEIAILNEKAAKLGRGIDRAVKGFVKAAESVDGDVVDISPHESADAAVIEG